jgi:AraC-like DNA-binding protein/ABC-type transporter Mla MlaB component
MNGHPERSNLYPYEVEQQILDEVRSGDLIRAWCATIDFLEALAQVRLSTRQVRQNLTACLALLAKELESIGVDGHRHLSRVEIAGRLERQASIGEMAKEFRSLAHRALEKGLVPVGGGLSVAERARRYADAHYTDGGLTIEAIARTLHCSAGYLSNSFKRAHGVSIHCNIRDLRLQLGERLLRSTDLPIKAIAFQCGFLSADGFSRAFRSATGTLPSEVRQI